MGQKPSNNIFAGGKIAGYFVLLLAVLIVIFGSSFRNPPRSDWWSALYAFHLVDASSGPPGFSFIINHDPWRDGTFRPLAHPLLYLEHRLFGDGFLAYHLVNLAAYFLCVILLYLLGRRLGIASGALAIFLALFALLFTHFDILTWTFHLSIPLGFSAFLGGLILYLRYLEDGDKLLLLPGGFLFLFALLCLELYILWPLGLLVLSNKRPDGRRLTTIMMITAVYAGYLLVFLLTRTASHTSGSISVPAFGDIFISLSAVFFNLIYNGLLVNLVPILALPLRITQNVEMAGPAAALSPGHLRTIVAAVGTVSMALIAAGLISPAIRRKTPAGLGMLFFFYVSGFFILALGRTTTANFPDLFHQFRYQYIPNAWLVLMGALLVDRLVRSRRRRRTINLLLILVIVFNVVAVRRAIKVIDNELAPLKILLGRISRGIETGEITPERPLAIPDGITYYLPSLCWNEDMGRFFRGTYQWIYSRREIYCFTPFIGDAAWLVDGETLFYRPKDRKDPPVLSRRIIEPRFRDRAGCLDPGGPAPASGIFISGLRTPNTGAGYFGRQD